MRVLHALLLCHAARALQAPPRRAVRLTPTAAAPFSAELPDLSTTLQDALAERNIQTPTPIQKVALEPLRNGASAVLAAETGSGKTLAFLVPTLQRALETDASVLVLAPTSALLPLLLPLQVFGLLHFPWVPWWVDSWHSRAAP